MKYNTLSIHGIARIPEGYQLIQAYAKGNEIIIPILQIPEDEAQLHNCDLEGCGTLDHCVRFNVEHKYV